MSCACNRCGFVIDVARDGWGTIEQCRGPHKATPARGVAGVHPVDGLDVTIAGVQQSSPTEHAQGSTEALASGE